MKSPVYTLANEEFAHFVKIAEEVLREKEIPHILVGGIATQVHVLERLCRHYNKDVVSLVSDENFREQDYLRATDAVDLALRFPEYDGLESILGPERKYFHNRAHLATGAKINDFCMAIVQGGDNGDYLSCTGDHIFSYGFIRPGIQRPEFSVSVDKIERNPIFLKISRKPDDLEGLDTEFYNEFVNSGVDIKIPYSGDYSLDLRVLKPEHLLAVKIALDRPKDAMDVRNLVYAMRLVGEFDKRRDFPRTLYQLRKYLLPRCERELGNFGIAIGVPIKIPYETRRAENALNQ
ncbi:MAG: hypothetical protein Q8N99_07945 [Nanoarchaeota archaeon]|nr:hypothetical protein [Nanoarchaeota archaeon]